MSLGSEDENVIWNDTDSKIPQKFNSMKKKKKKMLRSMKNEYFLYNKDVIG